MGGDRIQILPTATGVDIVDGLTRVIIDASAHTLRVDDGARQVEFGAVTAGCLSTIEAVAAALGRPATDDALVPLLGTLRRALAWQAGQQGLQDPALEAAIADIHPTPLMYAAPFLHARFLREDARRFRACRVAIAHGEDDVVDDDSPAAPGLIVGRLQHWRDLFAKGGKAKRALNSALQDFGEDLPAEALWGLRHVALGRPRTRIADVELLGWLGALAHADDHNAELAHIITLVEGATDAEVDDARLAGTEPWATPRSPRDLALLLSRGDPTSTTVLQLTRSGAARTRLPVTSFPPPPIPPPDVDGLRLITSADALARESEQMHHCVERLTAACLQGRAFIFHADRGGSRGTIHVDVGGAVIESRGPFNRPSLAAAWGAELLRSWGRELWTGQFPGRASWPLQLPVPEGTRPLRSVEAIVDAYRVLVGRQPEDRDRLSAWCRDAARSAVQGRVGLFRRDGDDRIWVRTLDGFDVGHSDTVTATTSVGPPRPRPRPARVLPVQPQRGGWLPAPPIPAPRRTDLQLLRDELEVLAIEDTPDARARVVALAAAGSHFYLRCELPGRRGSPVHVVFVEADRAGAVQIVGRHPPTAARAQEALALARLWTGGLWAGRLGMEQSTWTGERRVPTGGQALTTVGACFLVFQTTCERRPDDDGALARFYGRHVEAATLGRAWLVARDRAAGLVSVLDRRGTVIARTEEVLGEGGVDTTGPERPR